MNFSKIHIIGVAIVVLIIVSVGTYLTDDTLSFIEFKVGARDAAIGAIQDSIYKNQPVSVVGLAQDSYILDARELE